MHVVLFLTISIAKYSISTYIEVNIKLYAGAMAGCFTIEKAMLAQQLVSFGHEIKISLRRGCQAHQARDKAVQLQQGIDAFGHTHLREANFLGLETQKAKR